MKDLLKFSKLGGILLLLSFVFLLHHFNLLLPLNRVLYDTQIRQSGRAPLTDIVIVSIDKQSLDEIGRWPWPRDIHAEFLNKLTQAKPKSVVFDILFSEQSDADADAALANALAANQKVILPVALESAAHSSALVENLPIEAFRQNVAGLGHVDRELDLDAVSRRSYLYAGLSGSLQWPSIALEAIWVAGSEPKHSITQALQLTGQADNSGANRWIRSEEYLLPFAGKSGTFKQISYSNVLKDDFDLQALNNKYVLVGTTAIGMGDVVSTPVSGEGNPMPGVEVIANELDALLQGVLISEVARTPTLVLTLTLVCLTYLLWNFIPPRYNLYFFAAIITFILAANTWLLHQFKWWLPPANLVVGVGVGYLCWIWGRLVETVRYLNSELNRLANVSMPLWDVESKDANKAFSFLMKIDGFYQGIITDHQGKKLFQWDAQQNIQAPEQVNNDLTTLELPIKRNHLNWRLRLVIDEKKVHRADARNVAEKLAQIYKIDQHKQGVTPVQFIRNRIELVKEAHSRIHSMNEYISEVINQLYNGVAVTDSFGNIVMTNREADKLLAPGQQHLEQLHILEILDQLNIAQEVDWHEVFADVMFKAQEFVVEAKNKLGQYLLVEVTRYFINDRSSAGMVFNFIDVTALKETEQSRRELLAFLSHDLRSPLASLIATSDLAKIRPEYRQSDAFIKSIKDNAKRALQLADDFLVLMRAESVSRDSFQPVEFGGVIEESIAAVEGSARAKNIQILHAKVAEKLYVNGDQSVLERVLINLLSNAIKYSPINRKIEIGMSADQNAQELICSVKDNGYGIKEEDKEKVFQRFERINHEGDAENSGTGLGLAFVKSSLERHQGRIELISTPGEGSCFNVFLPLVSQKNKKVAVI